MERPALTMMVLVDTSVWSVALRRRAGPRGARDEALRRQLAQLVEQNRVAIIGPVRQELLSGIREQQRFEKLREALRAFDSRALQPRP